MIKKILLNFILLPAIVCGLTIAINAHLSEYAWREVDNSEIINKAEGLFALLNSEKSISENDEYIFFGNTLKETNKAVLKNFPEFANSKSPTLELLKKKFSDEIKNCKKVYVVGETFSKPEVQEKFVSRTYDTKVICYFEDSANPPCKEPRHLTLIYKKNGETFTDLYFL